MEIFRTLYTDKPGLSWAKLKFSLVRVVDVRAIFNYVEVEIEVIVELLLLVLVGWVGGWRKNEINAILNSVVV